MAEADGICQPRDKHSNVLGLVSMRLKCDGLWVVDRVTWRCGVVGNLTVMVCPIDEKAPQPVCRIQAFLESPPILLRKMEAMVEELARKTEDMALQKLAYEHEAEWGMAVGRSVSWKALGSSGFRAASLWRIFCSRGPSMDGQAELIGLAWLAAEWITFHLF